MNSMMGGAKIVFKICIHIYSRYIPYTYIHLDIHIYIHTYICVYICMYTQYMYTYTFEIYSIYI